MSIPNEGTWIGRIWIPANEAINDITGPRVISVSDHTIYDLSHRVDTFAELVNSEVPRSIAEDKRYPLSLTVEALFQNSLYSNRSRDLQGQSSICLLAPNDILATKACGVTFIRSLLERVIEEKAKGNAAAASKIRQTILETLGDDLSKVRPGSPATVALKEKFISLGLWSQYLEVGIGPDAEVFTKAQPMSSVGYGCEIGVHPKSKWNNPEPEVVLAVSNRGQIIGATLGNDVNLRDFEGRSALLLGEAKDQNGSCAIGPLVRLFDDSFSIEDVKTCEVELQITGKDGFKTGGRNRMIEISRQPEVLVKQAIGPNHQYPDGLVLFLGTMFAPTEDRSKPGEGFTHHIGDRVEISAAPLGSLVNWVNHADKIPAWEYGVTQLYNYLLKSHKND